MVQRKEQVKGWTKHVIQMKQQLWKKTFTTLKLVH